MLQPKFGRITRSPGAVPRMTSSDWRMLSSSSDMAMPPARSTSTGYFQPLPRKLRLNIPSLLRVRQTSLDVPATGAALEAKALLVAIDGDFPLATERAAEILLAARGDLVEHVLPNHRRFFVHRALPLIAKPEKYSHQYALGSMPEGP